MALTLMEGNEAIAWGALKAGCRFFAGYPITPATTIYNAMLQRLPPAGGICLQGEDEIASIGFCLGASMAGLKAMTATSGPGISLYSEQISFAVGSEIPLVIVDIQRLGPSTGSATKGADGDIQFLHWGSSGGQPVIVLAPVDVRDCIVLTMQAFNLAERFRCPVFIASNKEIAMTRETIDLDALNLPAVETRRMAEATDRFRPFSASRNRPVPAFLPIGGACIVRQTSSTHGPDGYITTDPETIANSQDRLTRKIISDLGDFTYYDFRETPSAKTLVITYGVTARAVGDAVADLASRGQSASLIILKTLWPVPEALLRTRAKGYERIVVIEMNQGQYVREIERVLAPRQVSFYGQMNGELIAPERIREAIADD